METVGLMLRIAISLMAVLGLMWLLARAARKPLKQRATRALTVLARTQLSRHATVAVVKVGDRALVLGVTDSRVTLLGDTDPDTLVPPAAETAVRRAPVAVGIPASTAPASTAPASTAPASTAPASTVPASAAPAGALAGSALSPKVWGQALDVIRERTARRS